MRQVEVAELGELVAQRLERGERHVGAHHVVGALEDREDPDVAQDLLVGLVLHVALAALELQRAVGQVPDELGAGDLAHRRLDGVVRHAVVDEAGGHVERGRFPRAVWPEKTDNLAFGHFEADLIDRAVGAVLFGQFGNRNHVGVTSIRQLAQTTR